MNQSTDKILINLILNKKNFLINQIKNYIFSIFKVQKRNFKGIKGIEKLKTLNSFIELDLYKKFGEKGSCTRRVE